MAGLYSRENMLDAVIEHAKGHIAKHPTNVEVYPPKCGWRRRAS